MGTDNIERKLIRVEMYAWSALIVLAVGAVALVLFGLPD
jgi:hypothetical protein